MIPYIRRLVRSSGFERTVLGVILIAAVLAGLETYPGIVSRYGTILHYVNTAVLVFFIVEIVLKMLQHGRHFMRYFLVPWNLFDFAIVVVCLLPLQSSFAAVLRLARVMRALRLMTALPKLQLLVTALLKSLPSMGYVGVLLFLTFYVYAVMGVMLFGANDPVHFRDLPTAMLTLFSVVTMEGWVEVMYIQMYGSDVMEMINTSGIPLRPSAHPLLGPLYFVSFVMFGTMIMLNLFIGVIINSMNEAQEEQERIHLAEVRASGEGTTVLDEIDILNTEIDVMQQRLQLLRLRLEMSNGTGHAKVVSVTETHKLTETHVTV